MGPAEDEPSGVALAPATPPDVPETRLVGPDAPPFAVTLLNTERAMTQDIITTPRMKTGGTRFSGPDRLGGRSLGNRSPRLVTLRL